MHAFSHASIIFSRTLSSILQRVYLLQDELHCSEKARRSASEKYNMSALALGLAHFCSADVREFLELLFLQARQFGVVLLHALLDRSQH